MKYDHLDIRAQLLQGLCGSWGSNAQALGRDTHGPPEPCGQKHQFELLHIFFAVLGKGYPNQPRSPIGESPAFVFPPVQGQRHGRDA